MARDEVQVLPAEVIEVFEHFLVTNLTTVSGDGTPVTWPVLPVYEPVTGRFAIVTSIGLPAKAINARRHPRVSLLYADPLGSGLQDPPVVRVQGRAIVSEDVLVSIAQVEDRLIAAALEASAAKLARRQPTLRLYVSNPVFRYLMEWYFLRLLIVIEPACVSWGRGDPAEWEVIDVG